VLALVRPFVLADQVLLGAAVALFIVGGVLATTFARQDAAAAPHARAGRALGLSVALLPVAVAVVLASTLQPSLLGAMWLTLARIVEFVLTPLGWLFAWLAGLFPRGAPGPPPTLPPRPTPEVTPDPAALAALQDQLGWLSTLILVVLVVAAGVAAMLAVRLLLANWVRGPAEALAEEGPAVSIEPSGTPRADASAFFAWLRRWLRAQLRRERLARGGRSAGPGGADAHAGSNVGALADAWDAYRRLLEWAAQQGQPRRPAETTGQFQARLTHKVPTAAEAVEVVTATYEAERYGTIKPAQERLKRLRAALTSLTSPHPPPR
jgi:hypothetical protein